MSISASQVKELREKTGAGMMDCKRALTETEGDLEAAVALLREKGLAGASKKAGRVAAEGLVGIFQADAGGAAVMLELNCETDFVAKTDKFQELLATLGKAVLDSGESTGDGETAAALPTGAGPALGELLKESIASIGENISLRRFVRCEDAGGVVGSYIHAGGKIGVLVDLSGADSGNAEHRELARSLAMHIAAAMPRYIDRDGVPAEQVAAESEIFRGQALASGKPEKVIDRIVSGKLEKFFSEICLLEQEYVRDSDLTIAQLLEKLGAASGAQLSVGGFTRFQLGEGIEKKQSNLAEEVAEQLAQGS